MADYTNSLGVQALTLDDINKQYGINASQDYAKEQADKLLQSNLQALGAQKTQAEQGAYQQSRQKDLSYFDQFQQSRYNTAGRGITGGMQNMGTKSLELGRNQDMANIYSNLTSMLENYKADEGRYRNEATSYADELYRNNLTQAQGLIGSDFNRRLSVAQEEYNRRMQEQEMQRQAEQQAFDNRMAEAYLALQRRSGGGGGGGGSSAKPKVASNTTGDPDRDALINYIAYKANERRGTNLQGTVTGAQPMRVPSIMDGLMANKNLMDYNTTKLVNNRADRREPDRIGNQLR